MFPAVGIVCFRCLFFGVGRKRGVAGRLLLLLLLQPLKLKLLSLLNFDQVLPLVVGTRCESWGIMICARHYDTVGRECQGQCKCNNDIMLRRIRLANSRAGSREDKNGVSRKIINGQASRERNHPATLDD